MFYIYLRNTTVHSKHCSCIKDDRGRKINLSLYIDCTPAKYVLRRALCAIIYRCAGKPGNFEISLTKVQKRISIGKLKLKYVPTMGKKYHSKTMSIKRVTVHSWDRALRFRTARP